jgi:hypothetical protein
LCLFAVFSKTLFTPAGIDVYLRKSPTSPRPNSDNETVRRDLVAQIVEAVKGVEDGRVGKMAAEGFEVPGVV